MVNIIRGIIVAILSTILISFVVFIFSPVLPFNIFEGIFGAFYFLAVIILSFIVYFALPSESSMVTSSQSSNTNHIQPTESSE